LLPEEIFCDLVFYIDTIIHSARVARVGGLAIIASFRLGPLGGLEVGLLIALFSFFLIGFNFFIEFIAQVAKRCEGLVPLVVAQTFREQVESAPEFAGALCHLIGRLAGCVALF
jgi:hypothetical protein